MRAFLAALCLVHHRLEQAAEDRRADRAPIKPAAIEQILAHLCIKRGGADRAFEQIAVHIGEFGELGIIALQPPILGRIENFKHVIEHAPDIASILIGAFLDQIEEIVLRLENAGVIGEHAKEQAGH